MEIYNYKLTLFATATHQWSSSHIFRCIIAYRKTGDWCYRVLFVRDPLFIYTSGVGHVFNHHWLLRKALM